MEKPQLRLRAIAAGLFFVIIFCALTPYNNAKLQNSPFSGGHFPLGAFVVFFVLMAAANPILSALRRDWRLRSQELLLIWAMVAVSTGIAYTGLMRTFLLNITAPGWLAAFSDSGQTLAPYASPSIFPMDREFIRTFYSGFEGGMDMSWLEVLRRVPWGAWAGPLALWTVFIGLVYAVMFGIVGLFSHQWIENEKMNFPLLRVPQTLGQQSEEGAFGRYLKNGYFLIGALIPVFLHLMNGLHTYYPQVPQISTLILAQPYIPKAGLLSGFYKVKIYIIPAFIGFAFLASKQVSLSFWVFFLLGGLLPGVLGVFGWRLPAAAMGTTFGPVLSRAEEMQMIGAFAVFFFFIVWLARSHLLYVARNLFRKKKQEPERLHGFMSPFPAAFLLLGGAAGLLVWLACFGMDLVSASVFLFVCFMLQVVSARLICQGGLPYFTLTVAPTDGFLAFFDSRMIPPASLFLGAVVQKATFADVRESLTPSLFHASALGDQAGRSRRRFLWGIVWAIGVGLAVSTVAMLALYYRFGIGSLPDTWAAETTRRVHENVAHLLRHPEEYKRWSLIFTVIGATVTGLLVLGYHLFVWWPLHPIGYLTAYSSAMQILWFGFFVGWLCNTLVLRYGGVNQYREVRRLFIGMIAGDMMMAAVWLVVGLFASVSYHVLPL